MNPLTTRVASKADARVVRQIRKEAAAELTRRYGRGHWSTVATLWTLKRHLVEETIFVASVGDTPVATYRLSRRRIGFYHRAWFTNPDDPAMYLTDMAVRPAYQKRGIGRELMATIDWFAACAGCKAVRFDAYDADAGAGRFYEKCGYRIVNRGQFNGVGLEYFEKVLDQTR